MAVERYHEITEEFGMWEFATLAKAVEFVWELEDSVGPHEDINVDMCMQNLTSEENQWSVTVKLFRRYSIDALARISRLE